VANPLAQKVEKLLGSVVGEFIAKATVKRNCELLGISVNELTPSHLPDLAARIEKSVSFFSGKEAGADVAEKIRSLSA